MPDERSPHWELAGLIRECRHRYRTTPSVPVLRLCDAAESLQEQLETFRKANDLLQREADCEHDMGEDARRVAREVMAERDGLKEQFDALANAMREIPAMEREGYNAKQLADYATAALEQTSIPASRQEGGDGV